MSHSPEAVEKWEFLPYVCMQDGNTEAVIYYRGNFIHFISQWMVDKFTLLTD